MQLVKEYERRAEECRVLARSALADEERGRILNMAEKWEWLAKQRAQYLQANPEMSNEAEPPWRAPASK
jgi:hypothetical protein